MKMIVRGAAVAVALLLSVAAGGASTTAPDARVRTARLDFKLKDVNGASVRLADWKGKVIILNFWATWCVPCKAEIPEFVDLQTRHGEEGLQMLGISADDSASQLKPFVGALKINYPVLQGRGHDDLLDAYGVSSLPVTVVIDRAGTIRQRYSGPVAKGVLEEQVKSLL